MGSVERCMLLLFALLSATACTSNEQKFTLSDPSISLLAVGPCDGVPAPVMTIDQVRAGAFDERTAEVVVTGLDPRTPTGNLRSGTKVVLEFTDESHTEIATFRSLGIDGLLDQRQKTDSIEFSGRTALEEVVCIAAGTVEVVARVSKYAVDAEGDESRKVTMQTGPFPIRCLSPVDFNRYCTGLDPIDASIDMASSMDDEEDASEGVDANEEDVDASDMMVADAEAPDMAPDMSRPPAWSISFVPPESDDDLIIGIRNSGFGRPDSVILRFRVQDLNQTEENMGAPLRDLPVTFSLPENPPPDVAIEPREARTDANGVASVRIIAGGSPGVVSVTAKADLGDDDPLEARSATVVIRGGIPSSRGFQFQCGTRVISAFEDRAGPNSWRFGLSDQDFSDCFAQLSDRVSGRVDLSTQVFYLTEAGSVDQSSSTDETGIAKTVLRVGPPAPFDTDPNPYELMIDNRFNETGFNPRDGLVTLVALTRGEEDFVDTNGNKIFDMAVDYQTPEMDLSEPFVDADDNGTWTVNNALVESFRDSFQPADQMWSGPNGVWDADTEIWSETRVLWVGPYHEENSRIDVQCEPERGCFTEPRPGGFCEQLPPADFYLGPQGVVSIGARMNDVNGNCLDAYGAGSTVVTIEGNLEEVRGLTGRDFAGRCFVENRLKQPGAPVHVYEFIDTTDGEVTEPQTGAISIGVKYRVVGNRTAEARHIYTTCRD
ncbi:MAG: hypothetical protein VX589_02800 [Myxococcota bacterium]|nr:hypothetical protein [Myxococcota bacterium]